MARALRESMRPRPSSFALRGYGGQVGGLGDSPSRRPGPHALPSLLGGGIGNQEPRASSFAGPTADKSEARGLKRKAAVTSCSPFAFLVVVRDGDRNLRYSFVLVR